MKAGEWPIAILAAWLMHHYGGWSKLVAVATAATLPSVIKNAAPAAQPNFSQEIRESMERHARERGRGH